MQEVWDTDQDFRLWALLRRTRDAILKARERELRRGGISGMESAVLFIVQAIGSRATPAEISRWLFRESNSVSGLINRMEKKGLVRKVKDLDRKNLVRVEVTEEGQQVYKYAAKRVTIHSIMSSLSEEEHHQLSSYLEKLRSRALQELGIDSKPPWP